jgi:hypothetical protein
MSEVRDTSIEAWLAEVESGRLATKMAKIFAIIKREFNMIPFTPKQLEEKCTPLGFKGTWKVVSELKNLGALEELPKARCPVSGRRVYWVKMTGRPPGDTPIIRRPKNLNKCIDFIIDYMRDRHSMSLTRGDLTSLKR